MMKNIWLIGASQMAVDYSKVLDKLKCEYQVISRGETNAMLFKEKTGHTPFVGGIEDYLDSNPLPADYAIVAVGVENLSDLTNRLINYGVKHILVEKPGGISVDEIKKTADLANDRGVKVYVAYNRRFYSSTLKAKEIIAEDGGVVSFNFEFTEWAHVIENADKNTVVKSNWFLANSTHIVDLAFYLGGDPIRMSSYTAGALSWHKPSVFSGAGVSRSGALFSYAANWAAPGRWVVEILTAKHRLLFKPIEKLQIQCIGSISYENMQIADNLDLDFKPGLFLQTKNFLEGKTHELCTIMQQLESMNNYEKILRGI